jgi:tyrosine-protein kinase Etk/Wzc
MTQFTPQSTLDNVLDEDEISLASYLDILFDHRWLIINVALAVTLFGAAYAFLAQSVYRANILIQIEDSPGSSRNILGDAAGGLFDLKTAATAEIEILRSRMVVSKAVDNLHLYINAEPKYFPVVGAWLARNSTGLSTPGLFGYGGYVWGAEQIDVPVFNVPEALEDRNFTLTVGTGGNFRVKANSDDVEFSGKVGATLNIKSAEGNIELRVASLMGKPGAQFRLNRTSRLATIEDLQQNMVIVEKGKQSDIINVDLEGTRPKIISSILDQIGQEYVRQNLARKSEEAEKSLDFLGQQLPGIKQQLEDSESKYNQFRNRAGVVDLGEEAKGLLQQSVTTELKRSELKQKKEQLLTTLTTAHPDVVAIDRQLQELSGETLAIATRVKKLPLLEQDVVRLSRDVKVNTDLYTSLLNTSQQLRLLKAGKTGTVRLVDNAVVPEEPVKPMRAIVILAALLFGLFLGVVSAWIKKSLFSGIEDAHEIEQKLGIPVYGTIPHCKKQKELFAKIHAKSPGVSVLAQVAPGDVAIEGLRSFRMALNFSMVEAKNNIILVTGATPNLGKSFISVNFTSVLGATGKKVLLIDADLRKGYLHQYFGLDRPDGLADYIAGASSLEQIVHKEVVENVDFISTGNLPGNPSALLLHENFRNLLLSLSAKYDYVLIDTPPILAVSDALLIGGHAGAVFMVARANVSTIGDIKESIRRLGQGGISTKGIVLNDLKARPGSYGNRVGRYRHTEYAY